MLQSLCRGLRIVLRTAKGPTEGSFFKRRRGTWKDKNALAGEIAAGEIATGEMEEKKKDGKSKDSYDPTKEQEKRDKQVKLKKYITDGLTLEAPGSD
ncbi:hypothetical protein FOZ62_015581 [Perkinsus olseni]|uniref:Uncharacterized protein n=1 Tax=Perkinsus olseni TaxID=32597 RepID=A0A7J6SKA8_PEROL|nr:hypothetical protein FOZ62_015581 [Perkinsus olseni]